MSVLEKAKYNKTDIRREVDRNIEIDQAGVIVLSYVRACML